LQQSLYYGPAGVGFVRILVARARDDAATYTRELAGYLAYCRSRTLAHADELLLGAAGLLNGARILHRHTREPRLATAASALAARLLDRISCPADGWLSLTSWGFGHGTAGIFHSLLSWSRAFDGALPVEFSAGLARFAEAARRDELNVRAGLARSWCNGSAGNVLLWTAAFECTQNEGYLELAERDALALLRQSPNVGADLCCGSAGRAYALLAMDRVQPNRGWHERALELGERAARAIRAAPGKWPHGLYKGYPGLVCLSYDLAHASNERAGFPLVEG
jgi:serine/threonine-protein kinase